MKKSRIIILGGELLGLVYGVYSEVAPDDWPLTHLPDGMGLAIALIALAMIPVVLSAGHEVERINSTFQLCERMCGEMGKAIAFHESDFYDIWKDQLSKAEKNVDVTHLGPKPPSYAHGDSQKDYFKNYRKVVKNCSAQVRRVERLTVKKHEWIAHIISEMREVANFSLAVYKDPWGDREMPAALSVCRVDDKFAWLIAMAEHQSTTDVRDLLITNPRAVELVRAYFQNRLWSCSEILLENGRLTKAGEEFMRKNA